MRTLVFLLALLSSVTCFAEPPKVGVNGPTVIEPGQLIVLTATGDATNFLWIPDPDLGQVLQCSPKTIGMASPRLGVHKVLLVGSNDKGEMSFSTHVLKIEKPGTPPPTDPVDPPPPVNPPTLDYSALHKLSYDGALKANDPVTAAQLQNSLNVLLPQLVRASNVDVAKQLVTNSVETTLLYRNDVSKKTMWATTWRRPIFEELKKFQFKDTTEYSQAIKAIASGLTNTPFCADCK
jgi:hypothetical protein